MYMNTYLEYSDNIISASELNTLIKAQKSIRGRQRVSIVSLTEATPNK